MTETQPQPRRLGYARVSTYGQTLDAQLEQLKAEGCVKVYREKASGARADRRELLRMLKDITPESEVTVTRIDRLARSTFDLFDIVKQIVGAGGRFRSLAEPWANTHSRRPQPRQGPRAAHGPPGVTYTPAAGRGPAAPS
jgi:DNA invertase Pin-like site-specific DNA recombinase